MGAWGGGGESAVQSHSMGEFRGRAEGRTGTYTQMLHLPFSALPLKKCPIDVLLLCICQRIKENLNRVTSEPKMCHK